MVYIQTRLSDQIAPNHEYQSGRPTYHLQIFLNDQDPILKGRGEKSAQRWACQNYQRKHL